MPAGRPTDYTKELADKICEILAQGRSMRFVCLQEEMPSMETVFRWLRTKDEFREQYEQAKEQSTNAHLETIEDLGDKAIEEAKSVDAKASNAVVSAYKLKADNIKWVMSKMKPKKYGEKLDVTSGNKPIPLLNVIRNNNSDSQDSSPKEEN